MDNYPPSTESMSSLVCHCKPVRGASLDAFEYGLFLEGNNKDQAQQTAVLESDGREEGGRGSAITKGKPIGRLGSIISQKGDKYPD
ncbi:hypothetical protein NQZ68_027922 [Dissostichus eleginoides]|nr:hypothetical protein NQZ68_027922 [Dissostichus eleginoides]